MTREQLLARAFVEAADTLVDDFDDFDVIDFLHTLARHCVQLLDVDAAGLMLADRDGRLHPSAASGENARLLELFELQTDTGPCVDAFRTGAPVVNADLLAYQDRWPQFADAARETGFTSVHALRPTAPFPAVRPGRVVGVNSTSGRRAPSVDFKRTPPRSRSCATEP